MNINITQNNNNIEWVTSNIIKKMYQIALNSDNEISYSGYLKSDFGYLSHVQYLNNRFGPELKIEVQKYYIDFEDPEVERLLSKYVGNGQGVSLEDAANCNLNLLFKDNTTITSFNEFGYFTKANTNPVNSMFAGCTNLSSIDLSETTAFSRYEFQYTAITDINAPNLTSVPSGSAHIFSNNQSLLTITSLGHITYIPGDMYWACGNLQSVNIPAECTEIQNGAFYPYNVTGHLQTVTGLENVANFGYRCFRDQNQLQLTAQDLAGAVSIRDNAFQGVKISSINSPNLTTLGESSFASNSVLTTIKCLGKVTSIPGYCFSTNTSLQTVKIPYECTVIGPNAFYKCSALTSAKQYTDSIDNWVEGVEPSTELLSRITIFDYGCFEGCSLLQLTSQDIQNATTIGNSTFKNTLLSGDIVLPQLSVIGNEAFYGTQITSIDLTGSSISSLPNGVFRNCSLLSKISIPTSVTYLDWDWGDGIANVVTLEGFDNCASHGQYNWQLYNKTILNPIKTSFVSDGAIMYLWSNDTDINYNQLYNPLQTSTPVGRCINSNEYYTYFTSRPTGGSSRVNIGLLYFRDISSFGALTFFKCNIDNLVINNVTPPTLNYSTDASWRHYNTQVWDNNIFPTGNSDQNNNVVIGTLWVPDSAVATYQADPLYSHLNIKGINTKTNGTDYDLPRYATYAAWKTAEEAAIAQGGHAVTGIIEEYM